MTTTTPHPLNHALALTSSAPDLYQGHTTPDYWNMVGPYGGITAATLLQAVLQHPLLLGEPLSLTVNFAAAVAEGPFTLQVTPVRTNRSTQHWLVVAEQVSVRRAALARASEPPAEAVEQPAMQRAA